MPPKASCSCGSCDKCRAREHVRRSRAKRRARGAPPRPWLPEPPKPRPPSRAVELDALLSEWRRAHPGSIVHVGQTGVVLHAFGAAPLRFETTDQALEFLTTPSAQLA